MRTALEIRQAMNAKLEEWKKKLEEREAATESEKRTALKSAADALKKEHEDLAAELRDAEYFEAQERSNAQQHLNNQDRRGGRDQRNPEEKAYGQYSILRAIKLAAEKKPLDGLEGEMHKEADNEARASSISLSGDIRIPSFVARNFNRGEKRDQTVGTPGDGGYTVATDLSNELVPILRPRLITEKMGATVLTGLVGNLDVKRQTGKTSAAWEGENTAADEGTSTFDKLSLTPKRLAAFTDLSKQWIVQSSVSAENFVRNDLNRAVKEACDAAFLYGATGGNNPVGILNTAGIGSVAIGTNGGAPTWAHIISLWKELAVDDADMNDLNFVTTPGIAAQLMQTEKAANTAQFVWASNNAVGNMNGYAAYATTNLPTNLVKGSSSDCNPIIFGDWSSMIIGNWAGIDLVVDPYTKAGTALLVITTNSYWNMVIRHAASFAACKDARVTI